MMVYFVFTIVALNVKSKGHIFQLVFNFIHLFIKFKMVQDI